MNVQTTPRSRIFRSTDGRAFRCPDRRRRHFRRRQRLSPDDAAAGHELRRAGSAGELWRHLADPPLSRHPLRQRSPHLRLSLQAVDRRRRSRRPRKSTPTWARSSPRTGSHGISATSTGFPRASWSSATNLWTIEAVSDRQRRSHDLHREFPVDVPGLLSPFRGLHAGMEGDGSFQGPHRSSAALARGSRAQGQEGGRDRLGRHRRDADPGDCGPMRPCHDAAALADLFSDRPQRHRTRRDAAAAPGQARNGSTRSCAARSCSSRMRSPAAALPSRSSVKKELLGRHSRRARSRLRRDRDSTSRRLTGRGGSASPSFPTPICSRASRAARPRSSPTRSTGSTRPGILLKSGKRLDADIIVTATGFNLTVLGDIAFSIDGSAARFRRHRDLSRHDVHRRAEHGLGVRLFPRQLDAAHRSGGGFRLPPAGAYEEQGREEGRAGAAAGGLTTCRCCPGSIRKISIPAI